MRLIRLAQRGFTVTELAFATAVLGIFMAGAMGMVVRNNQMARQNQARLNSTQAIRAGIDRIQPVLRKADRLLFSPADIPAAAVAAVGGGFFPARQTDSRTVLLRSPVFQSDGAMTGSHSYTMLHVDDAANALLGTYAIFRPDGSLDYKRRDEVLVRDLDLPKDRQGATLPFFTYVGATGAQLASVSDATAAADVVSVRLSLASTSAGTAQKQTSQLTSEIRLANQANAPFIRIMVYNPYGSSRTLTDLALVGPTTATVTRLEMNGQTLWSGQQALSATPLTAPLPSPRPAITGRVSVPATLWFTPTSQQAGDYDLQLTTASGDTLACTFSR
jgi:prepilin-type N-terminal cleavage/methylation domain-containing protein